MEFERDIEARLTREVEKLGLCCIKHGQDGWPDRIIAGRDAQVWWVELKRSAGRVAPLQRYRHAQLEALGQRVRIVWSDDDVDRLIEEIKKGAT